MMPLMSQVGRVETCSISSRPFSPAGSEKPIGFQERIRRHVQAFPLRQNVGRQVFHAIVEAGNGDVAVVVMQAAENAGQHPDRILRAAAEQAECRSRLAALILTSS